MGLSDDEPPSSADPPVAFLFDGGQLAEARSFSYRRPALRAVLAAVLDADLDATAGFQLRQGDVLLHKLAYVTTGVEGEEDVRGTQIASFRSEGDADLYTTLIWDLCDTIEGGWHAVDLDRLGRLLGRLDVSAITLTSLPCAKREAVHSSLRGQNAYLGAFAPDPGNPVHRRVVGDGLIHECDYLHRSLLFSPWDSEDPADPPPLERHGEEWFAGLAFREVRYKTDLELAQADLVPRWVGGLRSSRGEQSARILAERARPGHLGRLAVAVGGLRPRDRPVPFSIEAGAMSRAGDAVVEERKLTGYALNAEHESGGDKARWFLAALGIGQEDWRHLAGQLKLGLSDASIEDVRVTEYGVHYAVTTTVRGLNGASARVKSAWEVRSGEPPRLTTAYPAKREEDPPKAPPALIVPASLGGHARWQALWEIADGHASEVAAKVIPTPINVEGEWWSDGAFGFAWVIVPDARRGFARWLRQTNRAHLERRKGAVVPAPGRMVDPARGYAEAFAEVLDLNGIEASVEWRLD